MKKLLFLSGLAFSILLFSCSNDDDAGMPIQDASETIADFVSQNENYSSLEAALDRSGLTATLDGETNFTVFAPDNAAFAAFLQQNAFATLNDVPVAVLTEVLLNHVVSGVVTSQNLTTGYVSSLATGQSSAENLSLFVNTASGVRINGVSTVTQADVMVDNGVIHAVDAVIGLPAITTQALANPEFSILVEALVAASNESIDYVALLSGTATSPFTVFAPTNDAFVDLLNELGVSNLNEIDGDVLRATLNMHVITEANIRSTELMSGTASTVGGDIMIDAPNAIITDANGRESNIIIVDVQTNNGVIHAIDKVILPSS